MGNFFHLWPVLLFLAFMLGVSFWVQRASRGDRQLLRDFFGTFHDTLVNP